MKIDKKSLIPILLYLLFTVVYLVTLNIYGMGSADSRLRYYLLFIFTIFGFVYLLIYSKFTHKKKFYSMESLLILGVSLIFIVMSYYVAKNVGMSLNIRTFVQISLFLLPVLYSFTLINVIPMYKIYNMMQYTLIITIIVYFTEPVHPLLSFLSIDNWSAINFAKSVSFTESSLCSSVFMHLFLFFNYMDIKFKNELNHSRLFTILAFIFTLLSFKRLSILVSILFFVLRKVKINDQFPKYTYLIMALLFTGATYVYTLFMQGKLFTFVDLYSFTTGRDYILSLWTKYNYLSYGYGTSLLIIGRYLEMDLVQIYLELNIVAVFLFCFGFFKITKNKSYALLILTYEFVNLLTASSLPSTLTWIILLITISSIGSGKTEELVEDKSVVSE